MGGGGSKIVQNCVASFMEDPKQTKQAKSKMVLKQLLDKHRHQTDQGCLK